MMGRMSRLKLTRDGSPAGTLTVTSVLPVTTGAAATLAGGAAAVVLAASAPGGGSEIRDQIRNDGIDVFGIERRPVFGHLTQRAAPALLRKPQRSDAIEAVAGRTGVYDDVFALAIRKRCIRAKGGAGHDGKSADGPMFHCTCKHTTSRLNFRCRARETSSNRSRGVEWRKHDLDPTSRPNNS